MQPFIARLPASALSLLPYSAVALARVDTKHAELRTTNLRVLQLPHLRLLYSNVLHATCSVF